MKTQEKLLSRSTRTMKWIKLVEPLYHPLSYLKQRALEKLILRQNMSLSRLKSLTIISSIRSRPKRSSLSGVPKRFGNIQHELLISRSSSNRVRMIPISTSRLVSLLSTRMAVLLKLQTKSTWLSRKRMAASSYLSTLKLHTTQTTSASKDQ